ncbi:hypothetical protein [Rubritalea tangerina]|uniref:hypothetical protein n=1 Tax=Rubritalea tangerina TaxID=430798 RepID=UPI003621A18C
MDQTSVKPPSSKSQRLSKDSNSNHQAPAWQTNYFTKAKGSGSSLFCVFRDSFVSQNLTRFSPYTSLLAVLTLFL